MWSLNNRVETNRTLATPKVHFFVTGQFDFVMGKSTIRQRWQVIGMKAAGAIVSHIAQTMEMWQRTVYSILRRHRENPGDGVGYGVPKLQIWPGHSQRKSQCSSLQGWDFGRTSGASLWRPCLSRSSHFKAWWGNATPCQDFDGFSVPVSHGSASLAFPQPRLKSRYQCVLKYTKLMK